MISFSQFLREYVLIKYSRKVLLMELQLKHEAFSSLDLVTMSRWSTGVTVPSLYKQVLISDHVGLLNEFFQVKSPVSVPEKLNQFYHRYVKQFEHPYHKIFIPTEGDIDIKFYKGLVFDTKFKKTCSILNNIDIYKQSSINLNRKVTNFPVECFYIKDNNRVISFCYYHEKIALTYNSINRDIKAKCKKIDKEFDIQDSVFIPFSYYYNKVHFEKLMGLLLNRILHLFPNKKNIFFAIRGTESSIFYEKIGAKKVDLIRQNEDLYLYTLDFKTFISNPVIFNLISNHSYLYKKIIN